MALETISVIGLGYVGLPAAVVFGQQRKVIAFDINPKRLEELRNGEDKTGECSVEELNNADLFFTDNPDDLRLSSFTLLRYQHQSIMQKNLIWGTKKATETVGMILKSEDIVIYESTVYPGCTEEVCVPTLQVLRS